MADITMPQLGETVTEGTITRWFKQVGDQVAEDEPLFEVSTDKVDSEVPAAKAGYLKEILVEEGETVDVGAKLAVIDDAPPSSNGAADASSSADGAAAPKPEPQPEKAEKPAAEPEEEAFEAEVQTVVPKDEEHEPERKPEPAKAEAKPAPELPRTGRRVLSPLVRRLLAENDLEPDDIEGTGIDGRITRNDVMKHLDKAGARSGQPKPAASRPAPAAAAPKASAPKPRAGGDQAIPFSNIRKRTAEHMVRSQATSAHVLIAMEVDYEGVDRVRLAEKDAFKAEEGFSLTYLPFVARAVIDALDDFPHANASVGENELILHRAVHLGIAVDINFEGLIVPVIHDADGKRLRAIAREISDLATRARSKKLNADEISGGTFTITNPGGFGTLMTAAVINQPQVAILSTDGVKKRPVVVELPDGSDAIAIHPVGNLALSFDHRAFDGAYASAFLARCRDIIETRDWSQEL
ncbi:MAG TPA: dihydrolipoamide acetyltransferase family protein [Acidimicrobiales bacterium]|nr:dihydrolipoamide acetyltransferase family protein [Acidimicrobiales bacterium]